MFTCTEEMRSANNMFVAKLEGRRLLGKSMRRWEDNIKMNLEVKLYYDGNWIHLAQDKVH
jgi:hypothetical protein